MNRMLVVVFNQESKAFEAREALRSLDRDGSITAYAYTVITRKGEKLSVLNEEDDTGPLGTLVGTSIGSLIGLLGGPAGLAVGATVGLIGGMTADLDNVRVSEDFVDDVSKRLKPGTYALIAEIEEDWTAPVDTRMEALGGEVYRRALSEARQIANAQEVSAMQADVAQMKAEHAQAKADRKAKLNEKIDQLEAKIRLHQQRGKERREAAEARAQAKVKVLKARASSIRANAPHQ